MWTFRTHLQAFVLAVWTGNQIALRSAQYVNNQPDDTVEQNKDEPQDGTIHASVFGVARDPNQKGYVERNDANGNDAKESHTTACCQATGGIVVGKNYESGHRY